MGFHFCQPKTGSRGCSGHRLAVEDGENIAWSEESQFLLRVPWVGSDTSTDSSITDDHVHGFSLPILEWHEAKVILNLFHEHDEKR